MTHPEEVPDDRECLPEADRAYLDEKGYDFTVSKVGGELDIVIRGYALPSAYTPPECELLLRLPTGYPNAAPDMFWTIPDVRLANGTVPSQAQVHERYLGRTWQRWSRHFQGSWRSGMDGVRTYLAAIRRELERGR